MAKIKAAIYDTDSEYRERFVDYLMNHKEEEIGLSVFSEERYLLEALNVENYQLLILGCGYEELLFQIKTFECSILVLTEALDFEDKQVVYMQKYQSMDVITKKIQLMTEEMQVQKSAMMTGRKLEVIGIISPVKHEMQMMFSLLYAQNTAKNGKVLYINLMEFSGFLQLFGEEERDLSDLMILLRNCSGEAEKIYSYIYETDDFSYICPFSNPEHIKEITSEDIRKLLQLLEKYTDYQTIILDIGIGLIEDRKFLLNCEKIFCLEKRGYLFEIQMISFFSYMEKLADEAFLERVESIEIPYQPKVVLGENHLLERLNWSEFGDFVRSKI